MSQTSDTPAEGLSARCLKTEQELDILVDDVTGQGSRLTRLELQRCIPHYILAVYLLAVFLVGYYLGYAHG